MEEKRRYVRAAIPVNVRYKVAGSGVEGESVSINISGGGILLPLKENLQIGTILELKIELSEEPKPVFARGKVVWVREPEEWTYLSPVGKERNFYAGIEFVRFTDIDMENITKIMRFVYNYLHKK